MSRTDYLCVIFSLVPFNSWMMKLTKTPILTNCQVPNAFFWIIVSQELKFCETVLVIEKSKCVEINWLLTSVSITRLPEWSVSLFLDFTISRWHGLFGSGILNKSTVVHSPCRTFTEKRTTRMFWNISWFDLWPCTNNELLFLFAIEKKIWTEFWTLVHFLFFYT